MKDTIHVVNAIERIAALLHLRAGGNLAGLADDNGVVAFWKSIQVHPLINLKARSDLLKSHAFTQ